MKKKEFSQLILALYNNTDNQLKTILERQFEIKGKILEDIANILLIYSITNDLMSMNKTEQKKEIEKTSKTIKKYIQSGAEEQIKIISSLLSDTVKTQCNFLKYNINQKDVKKIVKNHYKGKHFSERVWENEQETATQINKAINDFIRGKVSVNKIKRIIDDKFDNGAYNTKRLVNTEVARVQQESFDSFAEFVGVKYVRYNAELDSKTCLDCQKYDQKIFKFKNKLELPSHPFVVATMTL